MSIKKKTWEILQGFRCADVSDAMDSMGLPNFYMDPAMRPMIPKTRFIGIARTADFAPSAKAMPAMSYEDFEKLQYAGKAEGGYHYWDNPAAGVTKEDWDAYVNGFEGDSVLVIAAHGKIGGVLGSENCHRMMTRNGVVGFVFDGYMRDTPESIEEEVPVFSTGISFVHPMGRIELCAYDKPVECAGVRVCPGDIICADHDGLMVIPAELADEVAYRCYKIQQIDRVNRRQNYIDAGKAFDESVELLPDLERWF